MSISKLNKKKFQHILKSSKKSSPNEPLITIITVVFNGAMNLEETILSVINQKYNNIEYIVIDGGSSDGTLEILKKYDRHIDYWVSEKDNGIYDAMNKGLDKATGDFAININIGDLLLDLPITDLINALQLGGDVLSFSVKLSESGLFKPRIGFINRLNNCLHHQGTFYSCKLTERYDINYKVFADFDLNQRLFRAKKNITLSTKIVSFHCENGISHNREHFDEVWQIIRKNQGDFYVIIAYIYFRLMGLWKRIRKIVI